MVALQQKLNALEPPKGLKARGYVRKVLQPGDVVRYEGRLHWVVYLNPLGWFVVAIGLFALAGFIARVDVGSTMPKVPGGLMVIGALAFAVAVIRFVRAWFDRWTTEVVVTDRRVLLVHGFISSQRDHGKLRGRGA